MPYIGRDTDKLSNVEVLDNITFDGSSSYTLQKGGSNFTPSSANNILISINGVVQAGNFTVSGSTIDFGTAVAGTSTCDFILHYGIGLITSPSDGTVTTAKLADSSVTTAKLNDASVSLAKLTATGTKDATTFLRGDNTFAEAGGGKVLQVVQNIDTTSFSTTSTSFTDGSSTGVSITPSSTSSKIYVVGMFTAEVSAGKGRYTFFKGGSNIYSDYLTTSQNVGQSTSTSMHYLDSPSTTSEINYKIAVKSNTSGDTSYVLTPITIIAIEIGA